MKDTRKQTQKRRPEFVFGSRERALASGYRGTPGTLPDGLPRPLDFERFDMVDFSLNDQAEEFS